MIMSIIMAGRNTRKKLFSNITVEGKHGVIAIIYRSVFSVFSVSIERELKES